MDDQLPEISGLEVVRRLRDNGRTKTIPIIAVFGAFDERVALDVGCDAYVSKPMKPTIKPPHFHFLEMIDSFLSKGDHQNDKRNG